jgi:WD40 repeat protein
VSSSDDKTIQVWDVEIGMALGAALQRHPSTVQSVIASPDGTHIVPGSSNQTNQLQAVEPFNQLQAKFHAPATCFSPNPIHALCSASSFVQNSYTSLPTSKSSFIATEERWIILGPEEDLLLWIPIYLPLHLYNPSRLVIPIGSCLRLDLSCLAHGTSWQMCCEHCMNRMT